MAVVLPDGIGVCYSLRTADSAIVSAVGTARAEVVKGPPSAVLAKWTSDAAGGADLAALPPLEDMVVGSCAAAA